MNSLATLLAPFALLLPAIPLEPPRMPWNARAVPEHDVLPVGLERRVPDAFRATEQARAVEPARQVRIEQRVIIRISPGAPSTRDSMIATLPRRPMRTQVQEEPTHGCVAIDAIAGVQPAEGNRLLLFMRDRRVLSAELDRTCSAQAFYSGFYVERNGDGQLCTERDRLQSRAGANCRVAQFNRLLAVRE